MNKGKVSHQIDMCSGPMSGKIFRFTIPLMFSGILQLLFNAADIIVVSNFCGDEALAAVGSTSSLINLIVGLLLGMSTATNVLAARYLGENNYTRLHRIVHTAMALSVIGGLLLAVFGALASRKSLMLMGSPEDVIELSTLYMQIYFLGMPANMVYNFGSSLLRAKGDTKRPLYIITLAGVVNVILNLVLVAIFSMSVDGVAIATISSQYISAILIILCLVQDETNMCLDIKKIRIYKDQLLQILRIGLPAGIQGMVFSFSNIAIQSSVNSLGKNTMAAFAAAGSIQGFLYVACNSFYQANMTFTSQNMGAGKWDRVKLSLKLNILYDVLIGLFIGLIAYIFARPLLGIYTSDPDVIEIGITVIKYHTLLIFMCGLMETVMGSLRGMGITVMTMIVSIIGSCAVRILWVATVFRAFPTHDVLFSIYPITWILTTLVHYICFLVVFPKQKKKYELQKQQ